MSLPHIPELAQFDYQLTFEVRTMVRANLLRQNQIAKIECSSRAFATTGSVASGSASVSCHLVKWSGRISTHLFPFGVVWSGPTRSTATFCQGLPPFSLCLSPAVLVPSFFAAWHTLQLFTSCLTVEVRPKQYQVNRRRLVVLLTPE